MRFRRKLTAAINSLLLLFPLLLVSLTGGTASAAATFPITESFTGSTAPNWVLGGNAVLTGDGVIDPVGSGWLRLTSNTNSQAGYAYYSEPFSSTLGTVIEFDYAAYGGSGADGTAFFLIDGATASFNVGAYGGGLGYAQNRNATPQQSGVSNAYVGIGLDEYGNFANPSDGRADGPGFRASYVGIRGPGNGTAASDYPWVTGASSTLFKGNRSAGIHVRVYITPDKKITVQIKTATQAYTTVINQAQLTATPPSTFKLGFAASTGGATNYHELRNLTVAVPTTLDVGVIGSSGGQPLVNNQTVSPGQAITYTATVTNSGQNPVTTADGAPVSITLTPGSLTNLSWTCTGSGGGTCGAASGTSLTPTADLPVGAAVTYTVTAEVPASPSGSVTFTAGASANGYTNVSSAPSAAINLNLAPTAQNQSAYYSLDTARTFALSASDADGDSLTAALVSGPTQGGVSFTGTNATYTPSAGYIGTDSFSYTVSDGKGATSNTATVSLSSPTLSSLTTSSGTLSPAFSSGTLSYSVSVPNTSITLTPTTTDPTSTVTVNGTAVSSGSTSNPIALSVGSNTINTVVTAADGVTTNTYTLTVTRSAPAVAIGVPTAGAYVRTGISAIRGTADVGTTVNITIDGVAAGTATPDGSGAWSFTPGTVLADGTHTVRAVAVASDGAAGSASQVSFVVDTYIIEPVDTTPPTITAAADHQPNANGWHNGPVTVTFTCSDNTSGVATCPAPVTLSTGGANQSVSGTATDRVGNSKTVTLSGINIDRTPPTITGAADRHPNANGWHNRPVIVTFTCSDDTSGVATCPAPVTLSTGGANQTASGTATDKAGNSKTATVSGINTDRMPPTITGAADRQPDQNGWYTAPVTVRFTCADAVSGVASCAEPVKLSEDGASQTATGAATDKAGNTASVTVSRISIETAPLGAGSIQIGDGTGFTDQPVVVLHLTAPASASGVTAMRFSTDDDATLMAWEPYAASRSYTLSGAGDSTIWVQYQNRAGKVSPATSAQVTLTRIPRGTARLIDVAGDPDGLVVTLPVSLEVDPNAGQGEKRSQVRFAVDGGPGSDWQNVTPQMQVPVSPGDGLRTLSVQFGSPNGPVSSVLRLPFLVAFRTGVPACYSFEFPAGSGPVGTYRRDPGLQRLVRLATIYDQATGRGTAIARNSSPGLWVTMPEPAASFSDVADSVFKDEILALTQMNIARGYADGTFRPRQNITRAEAATLIVLAAQVADAGQKGFPDTVGHWAQVIIERAAQASVVNGYPDGLFRPDKAVTRAEFVKMLAAPLGLPQQGSRSSRFTDLDGHWAQQIVEGAAAAGIVPTDSSNFRPNDYITREETVHMLFKGVNYLFTQLAKNC